MTVRNENMEKTKHDKRGKTSRPRSVSTSFNTPTSIVARFEYVAWYFGMTRNVLIQRAIRYMIDECSDMREVVNDPAVKIFMTPRPNDYKTPIRVLISPEEYKEIQKKARIWGIDRNDMVLSSVAYYCIRVLGVKVKQPNSESRP